MNPNLNLNLNIHVTLSIQPEPEPERGPEWLPPFDPEPEPVFAPDPRGRKLDRDFSALELGESIRFELPPGQKRPAYSSKANKWSRYHKLNRRFTQFLDKSTTPPTMLLKRTR